MARHRSTAAATADSLPSGAHLLRASPSTRWDLLTLALAGVILQYVWRIQEVFPKLAWIQFTSLVSLAAFAGFMLDTSSARRVTHLRHPVYRTMLVILVLSALSVVTSVHTGASVRFLTGNFLKTVLLAGVVVAGIRDRNDVDRLIRVMVYGGAAYVIATILLAPMSDGGRLGGLGSYDPNDLGLCTVSTLPLCIYLMRREARAVDRIGGAAALLVLLAGTVQTGSRGGFLGLIALTLFAVMSLKAVRTHKRITAVVVGVVMIAGVAGDAYWDRMRTILAPQDDYNWAGQAESGRVEVWKRGIGYMLRRPILGVGVDQFRVAEGTMAPQAARQRLGIGFRWSTAHNSYVQIGAELGVFGLGAFIALLGLSFREARRVGKTAASRGDRMLGQCFASMLVGFSVGGIFLSQAYATYLYFALAVLIAFTRVVERGSGNALQIPAESVRRVVGSRGWRSALAGRGGITDVRA